MLHSFCTYTHTCTHTSKHAKDYVTYIHTKPPYEIQCKISKNKKRPFFVKLYSRATKQGLQGHFIVVNQSTKLECNTHSHF